MFVFLHIDMILMEAAALLPGPLASPSHTPMHHADAAIAGQHAGLPGRLGSGKGLAGKAEGAIEKCSCNCIACTALKSGSLPGTEP
jgi:acyl dehydratase